MMSRRRQMRPFFKTHRVNGHPCYIYDSFGNEYKFIGLTHSDVTHDLPNRALVFNPNPNDPRPSYARPFSEHAKKNKFKRQRLIGYRIHRADRRTIREIKRNYHE